MKYFPSILSLVLLSCGIPEAEYNKVIAENVNLKYELEQCQLSPDKLLGKAKLAFEENNFDESKEQIDLLFQNHPGAPELEEAKTILASIDAEAKKEAEEAIKKAEEEAKAREEAIRKEKERIANATNLMQTSYDEIEGITWYRDKSAPSYANVNYLQLYIGKRKGGDPWLRLKIQYTADDWLFIDKYIIKADTRTYEIVEQRYGEIESDHDGGEIWEWLDRSVTEEELKIVKAIIESKESKIRYSGKQYHSDRTISEKEKQGLRNVLDAYRSLGGKI